MNDPMIACPSCKTEIKLTESLAAPLIEATRQKLVQEFHKKELEMADRECGLREREALLVNEKQAMDELIQQRLELIRPEVEAKAAQMALLAVSNDLARKEKELSDLRDIIKTRDEKLIQAQQSEAVFLRKQRELDDVVRATESTIEKRVQESLVEIREKSKRDAEDEMKLKVREKEQIILSMQKQVEDLMRKAESGSQQLQGEAQEVELDATLKLKFPTDHIERISKGESGADILQLVVSLGGHPCGGILWESKRTKCWNDDWLSKLRADMRSAGANVAIIISTALPKGVESFDLIDGVWIVSPRFIVPVALALRQFLIEISAVRVYGEGQRTKTEMLYQYLIGPRFKHRIESIVEKFADMQNDLDKERRALTRLWAKREAQIHAVIDATSGMYGDLQGIAGRSLQEIEGLELRLLEDKTVKNCNGESDLDLAG